MILPHIGEDVASVFDVKFFSAGKKTTLTTRNLTSNNVHGVCLNSCENTMSAELCDLSTDSFISDHFLQFLSIHFSCKYIQEKCREKTALLLDNSDVSNCIVIRCIHCWYKCHQYISNTSRCKEKKINGHLDD